MPSVLEHLLDQEAGRNELLLVRVVGDQVQGGPIRLDVEGQAAGRLAGSRAENTYTLAWTLEICCGSMAWHRPKRSAS